MHGDVLRRFSIQAGQLAAISLGEADVTDGLLIEEPGFVVRAMTLDHRTPVLAFSLEPALDIKVRKERLDAHNLTPGRWLTA